LYEQIHGYQKLDEIKRQYIYCVATSKQMGLEASPEMRVLPKYPPKQLQIRHVIFHSKPEHINTNKFTLTVNRLNSSGKYIGHMATAKISAL